jgi:hypothetical protein
MNDALATQTALNALGRVESLAAKLGAAEAILETGYAEFAQALLEVREKKYWMDGHESWALYLQNISEVYHLGRTQLYHQIAVVDTLQGVVSESDLNKMGITKAGVLAAIAKKNTLPAEILSAALTEGTTAKDLKALEAQTFRNVDEVGEWMDLEFAFIVTAEERAEIEAAMEMAERIDPVIPNDMKKSARNKEIALRFAREFMATYSLKEDEYENESSNVI